MTNQIPPKAKGWRLAYNRRAAGAEERLYTTLDPKYPYFVKGKGEVTITIENLMRQMETAAKYRKEGMIQAVHWFVKRAKQEKKQWMVELIGTGIKRVEFFRTEQDAIAFARKWMEAHPTTPAKAMRPATQTARKPKTKVAAAPPAKKAKKTAAKPAKAKNGKTAPELTAAQRKRLAATGRVTVKRDGKFITITKKV